jgi:hypothetical protein
MVRDKGACAGESVLPGIQMCVPQRVVEESHPSGRAVALSRGTDAIELALMRRRSNR